MTETQRMTSATYTQEVYEAIRQLTAYYVNYSISLIELKQSAKNTLEEETKVALNQSINSLRAFEKHAYIRLKAISELQKIDLNKISAKRICLEAPVPKDVELEELITEYNKILATRFTDDILRTPQQDIGELTGNL